MKSATVAQAQALRAPRAHEAGRFALPPQMDEPAPPGPRPPSKPHPRRVAGPFRA
jgi:hypothetical protein